MEILVTINVMEIINIIDCKIEASFKNGVTITMDRSLYVLKLRTQ